MGVGGGGQAGVGRPEWRTRRGDTLLSKRGMGDLHDAAPVLRCLRQKIAGATEKVSLWSGQPSSRPRPPRKHLWSTVPEIKQTLCLLEGLSSIFYTHVAAAKESVLGKQCPQDRKQNQEGSGKFPERW